MKFCALALLIALAVLPCAAQLTDVQHPNEQTRSDEAGKAQPPAIAAAVQAMKEISTGEFDKVEALYDPRMVATNASGKLAAAWASIVGQAGAFDSVVDGRFFKAQNLDVILFVCKFQKALVDVEIAFNADGKIAAIHFAPHQEPLPPWTAPSYVKPDSFTEQPLTVVDGDFELPGTLTLPKGDGPFPAVVLLQDSGPHDEDETIGPNKPFKDLAWGLASRGIAVLRYTKRTQKYGAKSNADPAKLTVNDEVVSDARAAVALLAKQPKIDGKQIYVVGHGLGGYLAPRIATGDPQIAGFVMLDANTQPLEKLTVDSVRYIAAEGAAQAAAEAADKPTLAPKSSAAPAPKPAAQPDPQMEKAIARAEESAKEIESPTLKPGDTVTVLGGTMPASYWLDLRDYHPVEVAEALRIPMLILQGGRDFQVPPAGNFTVWQSAFAHRKNVTLKLYPDLDHLMMFGTGPSLNYFKAGHVDEQVVTEIAAWIAADGKRPQ
jgi:uncharacterized protein